VKEKIDKPNVKEKARALRKKTKRIEESRDSIKAKSREKGKVIKAYQDRQTELEKNRDDWKAKCKEQEKERMNADEKHKQVAALFNMKEEQFKEILKEFEELKKKYPMEKGKRKRLV
jgi:chromosome segregation ATPase